MSSVPHTAMVQQPMRKPMAKVHSANDERFHQQIMRGERLRRNRVAIGLPLDSVAREAGMSIGKASEIERGTAVPNEQFVQALEGAVLRLLGRLLKTAGEIVEMSA